MLNLISNAIKFSLENDVVRTTVCVKDISDKKVQVEIKVQDYGIGMNEEDIKNLFKPYFKTTDEKSRLLNSKSHGLGLSICNKIA
jgi:signal transduction histidine kinase